MADSEVNVAVPITSSQISISNNSSSDFKNNYKNSGMTSYNNNRVNSVKNSNGQREIFLNRSFNRNSPSVRPSYNNNHNDQRDHQPSMHNNSNNNINNTSNINNHLPSSSSSNNDILVKMLVPAYATGSIIGKQGQTITQLQRATGICIKLSKSKDFYPGTSERIALIQGKADQATADCGGNSDQKPNHNNMGNNMGVNQIVRFIINKVLEFPIPREMMVQNAERAKQVKIIVPNSTAGLIIGKKGVTIKQIMDTSNAKVQMTQKPDNPQMQPLLERVITICGTKEQLFKAVDMILEKIKDDPQSNSCPNLSYQNVSGLIANANPVGSPYAPVSESQLLTAVNGISYASAIVSHHNQVNSVQQQHQHHHQQQNHQMNSLGQPIGHQNQGSFSMNNARNGNNMNNSHGHQISNHAHRQNHSNHQNNNHGPNGPNHNGHTQGQPTNVITTNFDLLQPFQKIIPMTSHNLPQNFQALRAQTFTPTAAAVFSPSTLQNYNYQSFTVALQQQAAQNGHGHFVVQPVVTTGGHIQSNLAVQAVPGQSQGPGPAGQGQKNQNSSNTQAQASFSPITTASPSVNNVGQT